MAKKYRHNDIEVTFLATTIYIYVDITHVQVPEDRCTGHFAM